MLMKEIRFRALLLTSNKSKTPSNAFTSLYTPTQWFLQANSRITWVHTHKQKSQSSLQLFLNRSAAALSLSDCSEVKYLSVHKLLENCVNQLTVNANLTCDFSNIPSLCAILKFLCYSVYSSTSEFPPPPFFFL